MARKKIHVIVNPTAGQDEPILNPFNQVFTKWAVAWELSLTKQPFASRSFWLAAEHELSH